MVDTSLHCPKCRGSMEKGYVADLTYGAVMQSAWTPGEPIRRRILGGIKWSWSQSANTPIVMFRCQSCGYLEAYAPRV